MDGMFISNNFILLLGPIGSKSVRKHVWHEFISTSNNHVKVSYSNFFELTQIDQINEIQKFIEKDKINHIIFSLPTTFVNNLPKSLNYLRNLSNCTLSCFLLDSFNRFSFEIAKTVPLNLLNKMNIFDKIYSFSWYDHIAYNFTYHQTPIRYFENTNNKNIKYDVFFIGRRKGRVKKLKILADYFEANKISYLFLVLKGNEENKDKDYKNLKFVSYVPYEEMITEYVAKSNCILSLCGKSATDPSLAYYESIMYKKKLLTDAKIIDSIPFTNKENQKSFSFSNLNDIPIEWLKTPKISDYSMSYLDFKPMTLIKHIAIDYNLFNYIFEYGSNKPMVALHFAKKGWKYHSLGEGVVYDNQLEAISLVNCDAELSIFQDNTWLNSNKGEISGKTGESLPIKAIKITSNTLSIMYRVFIPFIGWTNWARDGEICGFSNLSVNSHPDHLITGIQITTCPK
jgi:hypothetical protein